MKNWIRSIAIVSAFTGVSALGAEASAGQPVPKGTITVAAERLAGLALVFPDGGGTEIGMSLLTGSIPTQLNFPRVGVDYSVIDGLSIGGSVGLTYYSGGGQLTYGILPRIGYAFALSDKIDFWPRGGIGIIGQDANGPGSWSSAVIGLDAAFLYKLFDHVHLEFGPTLDAALANGGNVELGGNVGGLIRF